MYAVITGASSGIGEQFAKRLAKEGYDLILVARRRERLTALSNKLKATHKELECDIFTADLMQLDECQRLSDYLEEKDIEIFINNAGYGDCGLFEETDIAKEMGVLASLTSPSVFVLPSIPKIFCTAISVLACRCV